MAGEYHYRVSQVVPILVEGVTSDAHYYVFQGEPFTAGVLLGVITWKNNVTSTCQEQRIVYDKTGADIYCGVEAVYKIN
ncbi:MULTISPECIES: hypothetical protein [unclassified Colwellia]|uniref:hypothetical protein n=1 Tax=unclassified Colwellia TaxID=196834 RepID=UPI0015F36772|nr:MULTISPECIES: hypothetical protein [unclassified Colwellia]MBA6232691.1 hypothetical protein [Colwellia sp. MB02u-7]MBA6236221.1 hypothetical protein [Colwellia sp. MB02u-11]MBA6256527.1 hypothetical protein [Colwellia sp. MB3u-28]MBA6261242.1 hypothetical protein [Colwellia sp. MB3u-41]MBA6298379.1 hypothetical protein [Colwellia sp. MB3u-22]